MKIEEYRYKDNEIKSGGRFQRYYIETGMKDNNEWSDLLRACVVFSAPAEQRATKNEKNTTEFPGAGGEWRPGCVSLNLYGTLPWGWICVYRPCPSDWPSCAGRTGSSDDAEDAAPCFHGRGCRPRSPCSSADHRCCCSSAPPPADFYTHTHTTLHARLSADTHPHRFGMHTPFWWHRGHTHVRHVLQRTSLLAFSFIFSFAFVVSVVFFWFDYVCVSLRHSGGRGVVVETRSTMKKWSWIFETYFVERNWIEYFRDLEK